MATKQRSEPLEFAWASFKRGLYSIHTLFEWLVKSIVYRIGFWVGFVALALIFMVPYYILESQPVVVSVIAGAVFTLCMLTFYGGLRIKYEASKEEELLEG